MRVCCVALTHSMILFRTLVCNTMTYGIHDAADVCLCYISGRRSAVVPHCPPCNGVMYAPCSSAAAVSRTAVRVTVTVPTASPSLPSAPPGFRIATCTARATLCTLGRHDAVMMHRPRSDTAAEPSLPRELGALEHSCIHAVHAVHACMLLLQCRLAQAHHQAPTVSASTPHQCTHDTTHVAHTYEHERDCMRSADSTTPQSRIA